MQIETQQSCEKEKIRILHVDDDPTILTTTNLILESDGKFQVENA